MPVITISRQFGAGGLTLGKRLAQRFNFKLVDREIIDEISKRAKVSAKYVQVVEDGAGDFLNELISEIAAGRFGFVSARAREGWTDLDTDDYIGFVRKTVTQAAEQDDVIIIGRGGQFIVPHRSQVIKIMLLAEMEDRIRFMSDHYQVSLSQAEKWVRKEEKRRDEFLKLFDSRDPEDPRLYHAVINTSLVSLEEAEEMVALLIRTAKDRK